MEYRFGLSDSTQPMPRTNALNRMDQTLLHPVTCFETVDIAV